MNFNDRPIERTPPLAGVMVKPDGDNFLYEVPATAVTSTGDDAVRALPLFVGMHRFLPTLIKMQGGTVTEVPVGHRPRKHGTTKYGMWNRVWRSLVDAFAVRWMQRRALHYRVREEVE